MERRLDPERAGDNGRSIDPVLSEIRQPLGAELALKHPRPRFERARVRVSEPGVVWWRMSRSSGRRRPEALPLPGIGRQPDCPSRAVPRRPVDFHAGCIYAREGLGELQHLVAIAPETPHRLAALSKCSLQRRRENWVRAHLEKHLMPELEELLDRIVKPHWLAQ